MLDRTFEHGLGLFETFRTWNGQPTLLSMHIERLRRSAQELGLAVDPEQLPDARAVYSLVEANHASLPPGQDARLRLTLSGGCVDSSSSLWMTAGRLPPVSDAGAIIAGSFQITDDDPLSRHKTLNYWRKRIAHEQAVAAGFDDGLFVTADGLICETSRANIFLIEGGRLSTPAIDGPLLPGIMRSVVVARAALLDIVVEQSSIPLERIATADEAFLTNSVRGIIPIARLLDRQFPSPGPVTRRLWTEISQWLQSGGRSS